MSNTMLPKEEMNPNSRPAPKHGSPAKKATTRTGILRDEFAMRGMLYFLQEFDAPVEGWAEYIAGAAYHLADAMLAERAK